MKKLASISLTTLALSALGATSALAESGVRYESWGNFGASTPNNVCSTTVGGAPVAVACDEISPLNPAPTVSCGTGSGVCSVIGGIGQVLLNLSMFCNDGGDTDAIVTCK